MRGCGLPLPWAAIVLMRMAPSCILVDLGVRVAMQRSRVSVPLLSLLIVHLRTSSYRSEREGGMKGREGGRESVAADVLREVVMVTMIHELFLLDQIQCPWQHVTVATSRQTVHNTAIYSHAREHTSQSHFLQELD